MMATTTPPPPLVVELVGPAGAGKSSLARALTGSDSRIRRGPTIWGLPVRQLLPSAAALGRPIVAASQTGRPLRPAEISQMIRLGALLRAVRRALISDTRILVLDEGPVFGLAWLDVFFARNGDAGRAAWRRNTIDRWSETLHAVVRLDAADTLLTNRIQTRAQWHPIKDRSSAEISGFSARYRQAFERVLDDLKASSRIKVLGVRTDDIPTSTLAIRLRATLQGFCDGS